MLQMIPLSSPGQPKDIFDLLAPQRKKIGVVDLFDRSPEVQRESRKAAEAGRTGPESKFTCQELREEIARIDILTMVGKRKRPTRGGLMKELNDRFGTKKGAVELALRGGRCDHIRPFFEAASAKNTRSKEKSTFTCDDLKVAMELATEEGDASRGNITRILSELIGEKVPSGRITQVLAPGNRCEHLRSLQPKTGARRFTVQCEEIEEVIRSGVWKVKEIAEVLSLKKGKTIKGATVNGALLSKKGRCSHLEPLRKELKARSRGKTTLESFTVLAWN